MQSVCLRTRSKIFLLGIFVNQVQESVRNVVACLCRAKSDFDQWVIWVALNDFSMDMSIWSGTDANYRLRNEFCLSGISCVIFRVSVVFDLLMHFHCCPQRRLALAGCDSTTWISRWWEVGVWSDSYRHLLGPHLGALLQEVKHSRAPANTPWISSVTGVCVHVRHSQDILEN